MQAPPSVQPETELDGAASPGVATWRGGEGLARQRAYRGLTLEQAAAATRIRPHHLAALEKGELDSLPSGPYRRGYVRSYASFLGLDGDGLVASLPPDAPAAPGALISIGAYSPGSVGKLILTRPVLTGSALLLGSVLFLAYVGHQIDTARLDAVPSPTPTVVIPIASPPPLPSPQT